MIWNLYTIAKPAPVLVLSLIEADCPISKKHRNGRSFVCEFCGHSFHAVLISAQNIEARARTYRCTLEV